MKEEDINNRTNKDPIIYTFKLMELAYRDEDLLEWKSTKPKDMIVMPFSAWKKMKENYVRRK